MKKKAKLKLRDFLIVSFCLLGTGASLYYFWQDLNGSSVRSDKNQIATIVYKRKIAQRKYDDRVVWERLQQNSPLYSADSVKTADDAEAEITFKDKSVVNLNENTMVQLTYSEAEGVSLTVDGGKVSVDTTDSDSGISLKMANGSVVKIDSGSRAETNTDSSSGTSGIKVLAGNGTVRAGNGSVQKIEKGKNISVTKEGQIKGEMISVTSLAANSRILKFDREPESVLLKWELSEDAKNLPVTVEISNDRNFTEVKKSFTVRDKNFTRISVEDGKNYWRVYPAGYKEKNASGKISVEQIQDLKAENPLEDSVYRYRENGALVTFNWSGSEFADFYKLEVFKSENLNNPLMTEEVKNSSYTAYNLTEGKYKWRVTPFYKINDAGYKKSTALQEFSVKKEELTELSPVLPLENARISLGAEKSDVKFVWNGYAPESKNNLIVAKDPEFKNIVINEETGVKNQLAEKVSISTLPEGKYYWKVQRTSAEEKNPESSEIRSFTVAEYVPGENKLVYPPEDFKIESDKFFDTEFMWKLAKENVSNRSVMQISKNADFSDVVFEKNITGSSLKNISLEKGKYYWRVASLEPEKSEKPVFTEPRSLEIEGPLGSAPVIRPENNSTVTLYRKNTVQVSWTGIPDADYYRAKFLDSSGKILAEKNVNSNFCEFDFNQTVGKNLSEKKLSDSDEKSEKDKDSDGTGKSFEGLYKIQVQPFVSEKENSTFRKGEISTVDFNVRQAVFAKLNAPAAGVEIEGLACLRRPVVFEWEKGDPSGNFQFVLKKRMADGNLQVVRTLENPENRFLVERLTEGSYQWTITGKDSNGEEVGSMTSSSFIILPVPELSKPVQVQPSENYVINSDYLRRNRKVLFRWNPVEGATDYVFVLYHRRKDGTIRKILDVKQAGCELQILNLKMLDLGNFEWQVQAFCHGADGFTEQKSQVSSSAFDIDFTLPSIIKTNNPGRLYAN